MRELDSRRCASRVKGKPALVKSLRSLLIRTHRFGRHRARTRGEVLWAAQMIDGLTVMLQTAEAKPPASDDNLTHSAVPSAREGDLNL